MIFKKDGSVVDEGKVIKIAKKVRDVSQDQVGTFCSLEKKPWFTESENQKMLIEWCGNQTQWPYCWANWIFAMPNGMICHENLRKEALKEGLKTGIPDLFLPIPTQHHHGLFIEMKSKHGHPSNVQWQWIKFLQKRGFRCLVCHDVESAIFQIREYLRSMKKNK